MFHQLLISHSISSLSSLTVDAATTETADISGSGKKDIMSTGLFKLYQFQSTTVGPLVGLFFTCGQLAK